MGLEDDILPDTKLDRERTTTGKWALGIGLLMFVFIIRGQEKSLKSLNNFFKPTSLSGAMDLIPETE